MNKLVKKEKGFTIIEVVLVLAIAGLIFMVVFLAVPGLQRSQRDTQRKQDVGRLVSTITSFQGNNRGKIPTSLADYQASSQYEDEDGDIATTDAGRVYAELISGGSRFNDPSTQAPYKPKSVTSGDNAAYNGGLEIGEYAVAVNASCKGNITENNYFDKDSSNNASFAVVMRLEGGYYCQNG